MLRPRLTKLQATEFRSLSKVDIPLGPLTVLVGPNGAGKTNVLNVLRFLAWTVRFDLAGAIDEWDGFPFIKRQGLDRKRNVVLKVSGLLTEHSTSRAPDDYGLKFRQYGSGLLWRSESFLFKGAPGKGRRRKIEVKDTKAAIGTDSSWRLATDQTTALATLPRLADDEGGATAIRQLADFLSSMRVLEPDMSAVGRPSRLVQPRLASDASNLASVLYDISKVDPESFESLVSEMQLCLPGFESISFTSYGRSGKRVTVTLWERGVRVPISLEDASSGTVRMLALLTALHEPDPPTFTAIEEIDHGLHPWAVDILVERLRAASERSQILITTHSPTLVNRLKPEELVVCDRDPDTGESVIPCISSQELRSLKDDNGGLGPGELWLAVALGGVPRGR